MLASDQIPADDAATHTHAAPLSALKALANPAEYASTSPVAFKFTDVDTFGPAAPSVNVPVYAPVRLFPLAANLPDGTVMVFGGGVGGAEIWQNN